MEKKNCQEMAIWVKGRVGGFVIKTSQIAPPFGEQGESTELNPPRDTQPMSSPESRCWLVLIRLVLWTVQHRWSMANMATIITTL